MRLTDLLAGYTSISILQDREVLGLSLDSREVQPGFVFLACPGLAQDGRIFIEDAFLRGAVAVIAEPGLEFCHKQIIVVPKLSRLLGAIATRFYQDPSTTLSVIGITGTNGKTSCSHFISEALTDLDYPAGVIGTLGAGMIGQPLQAIPNTTPNAISIQAILARLLKNGAKAVTMEVSSHALAQNRVDGVTFETAVFTNLSRDHLDYHGSMFNYWNAKKRLLQWPTLKQVVVNMDDPFGRQWVEKAKHSIGVIGYSITEAYKNQSCPIVIATGARFGSEGMHAQVITPWGTGFLQTSLLGSFNLSNVLAALTVLCLRGFTLERALFALSHVSTPAGRFEKMGGNGKCPLVIIDYAHTPDALEKVLSALKEHCQNKLWCVFGCGGERDRGKRPLMAKAVEAWADHIIVTDDNPRTENPAQIVKDLMPGFLHPNKIHIEHDRVRAIQQALNSATTGDIVLIAGKGHETYQQIGTQKIPHKDSEVVQRFL